MRNRRLILAFILSTILSLLVGFFSNLAATYLAPSLAGNPWLIYGALIVTFVIALPVSIYLFIRNLPGERNQPPSPVPANISPSQPGNPGLEPAFTTQLPGKGYAMLVGRDGWLGDIMAALRDPGGRLMVGIDGMGGIGKTALAREVAERCQNERLFNSFVWIQAPKESFILSNGDKGLGSLTFEAVLDNIARQLGALDIPKLKSAEKETRVKALLQSQRVLVVLDNLETAKESQDEVARMLKPLLSPSKALLTSRRRFKLDLFAVHLDDLKPDDAIRFIRQTAHDRNITRIEGAEQEELLQIAQTTGSPLALKLIVGQLESQPLNTVLDNIRKVKPPQQVSNEDDYLKFYKFIFADSWRLLSENGKKLLISMAHFAPNVGGSYEAVKATSALADEVLDPCIQELWRFSLLERGESPSLKILRYYLHALTQYFVLSDIVKVNQ